MRRWAPAALALFAACALPEVKSAFTPDLTQKIDLDACAILEAPYDTPRSVDMMRRLFTLEGGSLAFRSVSQYSEGAACDFKFTVTWQMQGRSALWHSDLFSAATGRKIGQADGMGGTGAPLALNIYRAMLPGGPAYAALKGGSAPVATSAPSLPAQAPAAPAEAPAEAEIHAARPRAVTLAEASAELLP